MKKFLIYILTIGLTIFCIFSLTACIFDNDSNTITKDDIQYNRKAACR